LSRLSGFNCKNVFLIKNYDLGLAWH